MKKTDKTGTYKKIIIMNIIAALLFAVACVLNIINGGSIFLSVAFGVLTLMDISACIVYYKNWKHEAQQ